MRWTSLVLVFREKDSHVIFTSYYKRRWEQSRMHNISLFNVIVYNEVLCVSLNKDNFYIHSHFFFTGIWKHAFVLSECACMNMYNLAVDRCMQTTRLLNHLHSQWLADSHIIYLIARAIFSDSWTHAPLHRVNKTIAGLLYTEKRVGF